MYSFIYTKKTTSADKVLFRKVNTRKLKLVASLKFIKKDNSQNQ